MNPAVIVAIIELLLEKGVPAFVKLMGTLQTDNPTADEIRALKVKMPEEYE